MKSKIAPSPRLHVSTNIAKHEQDHRSSLQCLRPSLAFYRQLLAAEEAAKIIVVVR